MINNYTDNVAVKLPSVCGSVYMPKGEWNYSHHASITWFQGKFYAIWSNGLDHEDYCQQRVLCAESVDAEHWSKPIPLVTVDMVGSPTSVLTAGGFHIHDGCLYAFFGCYDYAPDITEKSDAEEFVGPAHFNTRSGYLYTKDGVTWSKPISLGLPLVANHGPQKTTSGRLIISGNVVFPYTDNPNGVEGYQITGIYADAFEGKSLFDDSEAIQFVTPARGWNANLICEGSFFQTDDDVLHMMLRSNTPVLWCSESRDDGETWSDPVPTGYSDDSSKFHFGRLPDGRYYGISNSVPDQDRCPLVLCVSEDGVNFNRHYIVRDEPCTQHYVGRFKHGHYGYPHSLVHEGYLYVIYSKKKESIEVTKIDLKTL